MYIHKHVTIYVTRDRLSLSTLEKGKNDKPVPDQSVNLPGAVGLSDSCWGYPQVNQDSEQGNHHLSMGHVHSYGGSTRGYPKSVNNDSIETHGDLGMSH